MTAVLEGGEWSAACPRPHFTPGKDPVPILQEAGWAPGLVWTGRKSSTHQDSIPDHPARSQSLYRLSYPAHIYYKKVKVKCTLLQALRLCTVRTAHRGSRGIAQIFLDHGTRRVEGSASRPGRSLPRERHGTHCTEGWVGPRAGLDRCGKSRPHRYSIPGLSSS